MSAPLPAEASVVLTEAEAWNVANDLTQEERQALKQAEAIHKGRIEQPDKIWPERASYPSALNRLHLAYSAVLLGRDSPGYPGVRHGITPKGLQVAAMLISEAAAKATVDNQ